MPSSLERRISGRVRATSIQRSQSDMAGDLSRFAPLTSLAEHPAGRVAMPEISTKLPGHFCAKPPLAVRRLAPAPGPGLRILPEPLSFWHASHPEALSQLSNLGTRE